MNKLDYSSLNWLVHKINNRVVHDHSHLFKGAVVDLGCGESPYRADILKSADSYMGVDWEGSLHDRSTVDVFADLTKPLPIADAYADTVVSFQVMEHLPEPGLFLSESYRILKAGGGLFITVPFMWLTHEEPHDYYRYTRHGLMYLLAKHGFVDIDVRENTGFWQTWALKFNYHTSRYLGGRLKYLFMPLWWLGQAVSPVLDRLDDDPTETASYTVTARKPL